MLSLTEARSRLQVALSLLKDDPIQTEKDIWAIFKDMKRPETITNTVYVEDTAAVAAAKLEQERTASRVAQVEFWVRQCQHKVDHVVRLYNQTHPVDLTKLDSSTMQRIADLSPASLDQYWLCCCENAKRDLVDVPVVSAWLSTLTQSRLRLALALGFTGLAFTLTESVMYREKLLQDGRMPTEEAQRAFIRKKFALLGIHEEFRHRAARSIFDLLKADVEESARVWYDQAEDDLRHGDHYPDSDEKYELLDEMDRMEHLYGRKTLLLANNYERGVAHGRIQALRWVLGAGWDDSEFALQNINSRDAMLDRDELVFEQAMEKWSGLLTETPNASAEEAEECPTGDPDASGSPDTATVTDVAPLQGARKLRRMKEEDHPCELS